jgi:dynein light intermediate chain 1
LSLNHFYHSDGAALFYTSVKEKKNIDKLYKYIVHKCYGYPFTSSAAIVERDGIFIPSGWDNPKKADILLENLHRIKSTDNYSDVFLKPVVRRVFYFCLVLLR